MQIFINSYGTSLRVKKGLLSIKKDTDIQQVPLGKVKTIFIAPSVFLTSDVLYECIDKGIDMVITERNGHPIGRIWNNRFGSISTLRKKQLLFSKSPEVTSWVINQMMSKTDQQVEILHCLLTLHEPQHQLIYNTIEKMKNTAEKFASYKDTNIKESASFIRAIEGQIAKMYFSCISTHLPTIYQYGKRSKHPAMDMTNALLNYAYGILYSHIESALIKSGLDPFIGFFHRDEYNRPVLTYDVIEVFRPWADWVVIHLCINEVFYEDMFKIENGAYWLGGDAKRILIQHFTDFFEEVIKFDHQRFSRFVHLEKLTTNLASIINHFEDK